MNPHAGIKDTAICAAARQTELAIVSYRGGSRAAPMIRAMVALLRALLPAANDEAIAAIVNLCALEIARERLKEQEAAEGAVLPIH